MNILRLCIVFLIAAFLSGCHSATSERLAIDNDYFKHSNQLYKAYLEADLDHARQNLQDLVRLAETTKNLELNVQYTALMRDYIWLCALEQRAGNQDSAELYFAKAKYWMIRQHELDGRESASDINANLKTFTEEKCIPDVDNWDKGASNGKEAHYVQVIQHTFINK